MMDEQFNPGDHNVDEVLDHLEGVRSGRERDRILTAESEANGGKGRVTILDAYPTFDRDARRDASGRILNPWEVSPDRAVEHVDQDELDQSDEARAQRELEQPAASTGQPAADAAGTGTPAPSAPTGGARLAGGATVSGAAASEPGSSPTTA